MSVLWDGSEEEHWSLGGGGCLPWSTTGVGELGWLLGPWGDPRQTPWGGRSVRGSPTPGCIPDFSLQAKEGLSPSVDADGNRGLFSGIVKSFIFLPSLLPLTASILTVIFQKLSVRWSFLTRDKQSASQQTQLSLKSLLQGRHCFQDILEYTWVFFLFNDSLFNPPAGKQPNLWCTGKSGRKPPDH